MMYAGEKLAQQAHDILKNKIERLRTNNSIPTKQREEELNQLHMRKGLVEKVLKTHKSA